MELLYLVALELGGWLAPRYTCREDCDESHKSTHWHYSVIPASSNVELERVLNSGYKCRLNMMKGTPRFLSPTKSSHKRNSSSDDTNQEASTATVFLSHKKKTTNTHQRLISMVASPTDYNQTSFTPLSVPTFMTPTKAPSPYLLNVSRTTTTTTKQIYLIRHGESMGQAARRLHMDRRRDQRLRDCGLTSKGVRQATAVETSRPPVDIVISSPLTRALHSAMLGFVGIPIVIHNDLAELGSKVPENTPRPIAEVLRELKQDISSTIDAITYQPEGWPHTNIYESHTNKEHAVLRAMKTLAQRPEDVIAVVCHFHVIQTILQDVTLRPVNATILPCILFQDGRVKLMERTNID